MIMIQCLIMSEIISIKQDIIDVTKTFSELIKSLPDFNITNKDLLPYGLKPHTRSVSWIVEQVIVQQIKYNKKLFKLSDVKIDIPDTALHDCLIIKNEKNYYVNIKTHNIDKKQNKNDISAVEKLFTQYVSNENYKLLFVCFGIRFKNVNISFDPNLTVFSAQFIDPIYINPRNDKLQAYYNHTPKEREKNS